MNNLDFLKIDKLKIKTIRLLFPLHKENLTSYLSPLLGQYAIKNNEFITEFVAAFNKATNNVFKEIISTENTDSGGSLHTEHIFVPLLINIYKGGKFVIKVCTPALGFLFSSGLKKKRRFIRHVVGPTDNFNILRNYKKLLQVTVFKYSNSSILEAIPTTALLNYKDIRNALFKQN